MTLRNENRRIMLQKKSVRGFTLIEMLISLALSAFLLVAVFQSTYLSARYRNMSVESNGAVTSISNTLRDISCDITSQAPIVVPAADNKTGATVKSNGPKSDFLNLPTDRMEWVDSFSATLRTEWALFSGQAATLAMQPAATTPRFNALPSDALRIDTNLVVWWVYAGSTPSIKAWRANGLLVAKPLKVPDHPRGLIRTQIYLNKRGAECQHSEVVHPDVTKIQFHYWDAGAEFSDWDDWARKQLPQAVRVQLTVGTDEVEQWIRIAPVQDAKRSGEVR